MRGQIKRKIERKITQMDREELYQIKKRLTNVQKLLNTGEFEEALDELRRIQLDLSHLIIQIRNKDAKKELIFAENHISKAINILFNEIFR